jgi:hypothetical protein
MENTMNKNTITTMNVIGIFTSIAGIAIKNGIDALPSINKKIRIVRTAKTAKTVKTAKAVNFTVKTTPTANPTVYDITADKIKIRNADGIVNLETLDEYRTINKNKNDKMDELEKLYSEKGSMESKGITNAIEEYAKGETQIMYNAYLFCYSQMNQLKKRITEYNEIIINISKIAKEIEELNKELEKYEF